MVYEGSGDCSRIYLSFSRDRYQIKFYKRGEAIPFAVPTSAEMIKSIVLGMPQQILFNGHVFFLARNDMVVRVSLSGPKLTEENVEIPLGAFLRALVKASA